jgi:outer membrane biosynthesis protein TonB
MAPGPGRRGPAALPPKPRWSLDYGQSSDEVLQAMLIPRLGAKEQEADKLPKILKYEQPDKFEEAVNISNDEAEKKELPKAMKPKEAEVDKKRKKKSLDELMEAPEEEDPRARPTMLSEMIGREDGSTYGEGTQAREGEAYLGKLEMRLRQSFRVPAYLTDEDLKKLKVEIKLLEMDDRGRILRYRVMIRSGTPGFDGAAIDAIRRFVPSEGGQDSFDAPPPELLQMVNARGVLLRLDGRKLGR